MYICINLYYTGTPEFLPVPNNTHPVHYQGYVDEIFPNIKKICQYFAGKRLRKLKFPLENYSVSMYRLYT